MRIAQLSPLYESVPPRCYGGTERIVSYLTEELVRQGHEVTLYASADSKTDAELIPVCKRALRTDKNCEDPIAHHMLMLEMAYKDPEKYDIIHGHLEYLPYSLFRRSSIPTLSTLHNRLDSSDFRGIYTEFCDLPVISISDSQRSPVSFMNWQRTIYHGLPLDLYKPYMERGDYLLFLGRISREKRPDRAIEIAKKAGVPLKIAAKVAEKDMKYFKEEIVPLMDDPLIEYVGEIQQSEKNELMGKALALLFPIDWPEPFGLVMIEAMACGVPTIAWRNGSVPEVIDPGETGFVVDSIEAAVQAVEQSQNLDRIRCRQIFEERFSVAEMTRNYLSVYRSLIFSHQGIRFIPEEVLEQQRAGGAPSSITANGSRYIDRHIQ